MGMQHIRADGASQTWYDSPASPIDASAPSESAWRWNDIAVAAIAVGTIAAYFLGVFS